MDGYSTPHDPGARRPVAPSSAAAQAGIPVLKVIFEKNSLFSLAISTNVK